MELVDLYDEDRLPLGRTAERHAPKGPGEYRTVIHVCVFNSRGQLLIQRRSREKTVWPERWDVSVGGGVDAGENIGSSGTKKIDNSAVKTITAHADTGQIEINFEGE